VKLKNQKVEKYVHERLLLAEGGFWESIVEGPANSRVVLVVRC
jgi:hypothetical protein